MQAFRFRLQRILNWQQKVCQVEEDQLKLCLLEVARVQQRLAKLAARSVAIEHEFLEQRAMSPVDLKAFAQFRWSTVKERRALHQAQQKSEALVAEQRQKLLAERRRLQVFEKLRQRAWAEYSVAADRELEALGLESFLSALITRRSASPTD